MRLTTHVSEALRDALQDAESNIKWMSESKKRLVKEKGDPREIERREKWIAKEVERVVELRAALGKKGPRDEA